MQLAQFPSASPPDAWLALVDGQPTVQRVMPSDADSYPLAYYDGFWIADGVNTAASVAEA